MVFISGGAFDISPHHYGQIQRTRLDHIDEQRTGLELLLAKRCVDVQKPSVGYLWWYASDGRRNRWKFNSRYISLKFQMLWNTNNLQIQERNGMMFCFQMVRCMIYMDQKFELTRHIINLSCLQVNIS